MEDKTLVEIFAELHKQIIPEVNDPLKLQTIYMQQMVIMMAAIDDDLKALRKAILDQASLYTKREEDNIKHVSKALRTVREDDIKNE